MDRPLDSLPSKLDAQAASPLALDDFRITTQSEVLGLLKQLSDSRVLVNLNSSTGGTYTSTVLALDPARGTLSFSADADDSQVQALVESEDAIAVAYLDSIKLQFDAQGLVLVRGGRTSALNCALPREVFRFQRRNGFRVRPLLRATPTARVRHPMIPDMSLSLRVLDVSIGGCALFLPDDVPPLQPGVTINNVQIDLDIDTRITITLRLQHVTSIHPESRGVRLGCEMVNLTSDVLRGLQRYIDQTQKRQKIMGPSVG